MNDPRDPFNHRPDAAGSDDYSATVLGSHWFEPGAAPVEPGSHTPVLDPPTLAVTPDRVEGEVLRFGPGVTAAAARRHSYGDATTPQIWHGTLPGQRPGQEPLPERRRTGARRYALAGVVLLAVLAFLAWQRYGPGPAVKEVAVTTTGTLGCDSTADIVGMVTTDGRPGTLTYRWERSDGTTSAPLTETLTSGQKQARLHLLWTFHGRGEYRASATLVITSPSRHRAIGRFAYACA